MTEDPKVLRGDAKEIVDRLRAVEGDTRRLALDAAMMIEYLYGKALASLPAQADGTGEVGRTMSGETVNGVPILAWMWEEDVPGVGPTRKTVYHWSTPPKNVKVTRLVDAEALASPPAPLQEGWVAVPELMTAQMINAWSGGLTVTTDEIAYRTHFQEAWKRVLAARPTGGGNG